MEKAVTYNPDWIVEKLYSMFELFVSAVPKRDMTSEFASVHFRS